MISQKRQRRTGPKCFGCNRWASREVVIEGSRVWMCDACPTPQEIEAGTARIQSTWSDDEYYARAWGCSLDQARDKRGCYDFRDHICRTGSLERSETCSKVALP